MTIEIRHSGDTVVVNEPNYTVEASEERYTVSVASSIIIIDEDPFPGPYSVRPNFTNQVLNTIHKTMTSNLEVQPIPVSEVSNASGGWTMTIGD